MIQTLSCFGRFYQRRFITVFAINRIYRCMRDLRQWMALQLRPSLCCHWGRVAKFAQLCFRVTREPQSNRYSPVC